MDRALYHYNYMLATIDPFLRSMGLETVRTTISRTYNLLPEQAMYVWRKQAVSETAAIMGWCMSRYHRYGQIAYEPTEELLAALEKTSLRNIATGEIQMPYPTFWINLSTAKNLRIWGGEDTRWHKVSGCYVSYEMPLGDEHGNELAPGTRISVMVWGPPNERSSHAGDDSTFWFHIPLSDFATGDALEAEIQERTNKVTHGILEHGITWSDQIVRTEMTEVATRVTRLVCNFLLFLKCSACKPRHDTSTLDERRGLQKRLSAIKNPKKHRKDVERLSRAIELLPEAKVIRIGERLELQRAKQSKPTSKTGRVAPWHWVGFHWQHVWSGPKKDEHGNPQPGTKCELRLIAPYEAGSKDVASAKTIRVGK